MIKVFCLDDGVEYLFSATSGYEAMQKMLYTLNLEHKDKNAEIEFAKVGLYTIKAFNSNFETTINVAVNPKYTFEIPADVAVFVNEEEVINSDNKYYY